MLINPRLAVEQGWVDGLVNPNKQIQPNAIDFTVDRVFSINDDSVFTISETQKQMRTGCEEIEPQVDSDNDEKWWTIEPHTSYDAMSNIYVEVPEGMVANLIIRSTFNRNGIFLTSGLYDSGFKGNIGFAIHNNSGKAQIAQGTRIGQITFTKSDSEGIYSGGYNTENGAHWNAEGPGDFNEQK